MLGRNVRLLEERGRCEWAVCMGCVVEYRREKGHVLANLFRGFDSQFLIDVAKAMNRNG